MRETVTELAHAREELLNETKTDVEVSRDKQLDTGNETNKPIGVQSR